MYKPTDRQMSLLSPGSSLADGAERRLRQSWADGFQRHVLPVLLAHEDAFASLYDDATGRPNWSVARLLGLNILQQLEDLTDQQAVDALAFDLRFQHALGLTSDEAYVSRRSYVAFRMRLAQGDPEMRLLRSVFAAVGEAAIDDLRISTSSQRIDSTLITSNIRTRGRVDLFGKTLRHFVENVLVTWPEHRGLLGGEVLAWHERSTDGSFASTEPGKTQRAALVKQLAGWMLGLIEAFADHDEVAASEPYQLLVRLFNEQCRVKTPGDGKPGGGDTGGDTGYGATPEEGAAADDAGPMSDTPTESAQRTEADIVMRKKPQAEDGLLQSPYDPDASYGHKGSGFHVQVTETAGNVATEILTDFAVHGAHVSDHGQAERALERLEGEGRRPETLYADSGYASGQSLLNTMAGGTELYTPVVAARLPRDQVGRERFTFDEATGEVLSCPRGHAPKRHALRSTVNESGPSLHAYFDGATCRACPIRGRCVVRGSNNGKPGSFHVELLPRLRARDEAWARQRNSAWWRPYRTRCGVEATMSELKRAHGLGRLRVRRRVKVEFMVALKLTACNVKRWLRVRRPSLPEPSDAPGPHRSGRPHGRPSADGPWRDLAGKMPLLARLARRLGRCFQIPQPQLS
jgi:hypothetical protein